MNISDIIYECQVKPNTYGLITRRTWKELKTVFDTHVKLSGASRISKVESVYHYANGSKIYFSTIHCLRNIERHLGMYYDFMDIDYIMPKHGMELLKRIRPDDIRKILKDL